MILPEKHTTIVAESGRRIHIVPDNEVVFTHSEIAHMQALGISREYAEFIALTKEVFGTSAEVEFENLTTTEREAVQMALFNFSKEAVEDQSFDVVPAGRYLAQVCDHSMKPTKTGGHILNLTLEITGPTHAGRKLFEGLNIDNQNEKAVMIALATLKSICTHAGQPDYYAAFHDAGERADSIEDLEPILAELPLAIYAKDIAVSVVVEPAKDGYPEKNKIKAYGPASGIINATTTSAPPKAPPKKPSWSK